MWPFKKKELKIKVPSYLQEIHRKERELFDQYPIGSNIKYLDIDLKVVSHQYNTSGFHSSYVNIPPTYTALKCNYIDKEGVIRQHDFSLNQAMTLLEISP